MGGQQAIRRLLVSLCGVSSLLQGARVGVAGPRGRRGVQSGDRASRREPPYLQNEHEGLHHQSRESACRRCASGCVGLV